VTETVQFLPLIEDVLLSRPVCSICGLTEDFHGIENETDGVPLGHENNQIDSMNSGNSGDNKSLSLSPGKRKPLRLEVPHPAAVFRTLSAGGRLPAITFGSIIIPHRFLGRVREDSLGGIYKGQFTVRLCVLRFFFGAASKTFCGQ
jgi:hypothetical protein